jgi:hypothetical protein
MKKISASVISLALIFIFAATAYPRINLTGITTTATPLSQAVRYVVDITLPPMNTPICGAYAVLVLDANGNQVAPPQAYIPGVATYTFYEFTGRPFIGDRIARMVQQPSPPEGPVCRQQLFTQPESLYNMFIPGQSYRFTLYPSFQPFKN